MNVLAARLKALEGRTTGQGPCPEHRARAEDRPRSYRDGLDAFLPFPEDGARPAAAGGALRRRPALPPLRPGGGAGLRRRHAGRVGGRMRALIGRIERAERRMRPVAHPTRRGA